jgi:hypothetical protein
MTRPIAPRTGAEEITVAEDQPEYSPITVALYRDPAGARHLLTRWTFTAEERAAIAAGEDVYVAQIAHPAAPMTPMWVHVGPGPYG